MGGWDNTNASNVVNELINYIIDFVFNFNVSPYIVNKFSNILTLCSMITRLYLLQHILVVGVTKCLVNKICTFFVSGIHINLTSLLL